MTTASVLPTASRVGCFLSGFRLASVATRVLCQILQADVEAKSAFAGFATLRLLRLGAFWQLYAKKSRARKKNGE